MLIRFSSIIIKKRKEEKEDCTTDQLTLHDEKSKNGRSKKEYDNSNLFKVFIIRTYSYGAQESD